MIGRLAKFFRREIIETLWADNLFPFTQLYCKKRGCPKVIKRVVIFNLDSLGDSLMITPLIQRSLESFKDAQFDIILNEIVAPLFYSLQDNPRVSLHYMKASEYYVHRNIVNIPKFLKNKNIDLFLIPEMGVRPADYARRLARKIGAKFISATHLGLLRTLDDFHPMCNTKEYWPDYFLRLLLPFIEVKSCPIHNYFAPVKSDVLRKSYIIIHPSVASYARLTKKWSNRSFIDLIKRLKSLYPDKDIILTGAADESSDAIEIASEVDVVNMVGQLSLKELFSLVAFSDAVVSADTFIYHLSLSYKRPTIVIFGPTDYKKLSPKITYNSKVFYSNLECSPCHQTIEKVSWPTCIYKENKCMIETTPEIVFDAIRELLDDK